MIEFLSKNKKPTILCFVVWLITLIAAYRFFYLPEIDKTLFFVIIVTGTLACGLCLWAANHFLSGNDGQKQEVMENIARIGPYSLVDKIGQGGMADLWKAEHTSEDGFRRIVALKKILPHLTQDQDFINMFIREARIAAFLHHPNIVQIINYGRYEHNYYIVMEYVNGGNLADIMNKVKAGLPIDMAVFIALKIIAGLQYAHSKKDDKSEKSLDIVHRDISPHNIMISYEGEVKITDFGLARAQSEPRFTRTGQVKGKQQYMSPEQALGQEVDCRTDIYAFGIVIYEILTGHQLFEFKNDVEAILSIPEEIIKPLNSIRHDLPNGLNRIIMKCLEKDRDLRFQTAQEIFHELLQLKKESNLYYDSNDLSGFMKQYFE